MSARRAPLAALAVVVLALAGCGGSTRATRCEAPLRAAFPGVSAPELLAAGPAARRRTMAAQRRAGVRTLRQVLDWQRIETAPGVYDLGAYDGFVADAARAGLTLLPVLYGVPPFRALPGSGRAVARPRDLDDIGPFARAMARRYGPGGTFWASHPQVPVRPVRSWQVWNEPNLGLYWGGTPDARAYARLLRAASTAIRSVDRRAQIVTAGLPDSRSGVRLATYLRQLYAAGARGTFDTVALNLYAHSPASVLLGIRRVRQVLVAAGDPRAHLWLTEFGWADAGPKSTFTVGADRQARYVRQTLEQAAASARLLRLRGAIYYAWKDLPPYRGIGDFWGLHTGLLDEGGVPKPALAAFAEGASVACSR